MTNCHCKFKTDWNFNFFIGRIISCHDRRIRNETEQHPYSATGGIATDAIPSIELAMSTFRIDIIVLLKIYCYRIAKIMPVNFIKNLVLIGIVNTPQA